MTRYKIRPGDQLDAVAYAHYGAARADSGLAAIYAANPRLSELSVSPPPQTIILLPDLPAPATTQLWD